MRWPSSLICLVLLTFAACDSGVELDVAGPREGLGSASILAMKVYGSDMWLADASATLIHEQTEPLPRLPVSIDLALPENPHKLIDQGNGPVEAEDARYHVIVYGDRDGDGQICPGDLRQANATFEDAFFGPGIPDRLDVALETVPADAHCHAR